MNYRFWFTCLIFMVGHSFFAVSLLAATPKKYALLIAVTDYNDGAMNTPKLDFPEDDARAMGSFLELYGYKCDYLLGDQATRANIEKKLKQFSGKSNQTGVVVLGLWGHGVEFDGGEAMFCPFDTTVRIAEDADGKTLFASNGSGDALIEPNPSSLVGMSRFLSGLRICGAGNRLLIADCCRVKPNAARGRGAFGSKITAADLPQGTAAIFACAADQKAFEHDTWKHGALTKAMLEELESIAGRDTSRVSDIIGRVSDSVTSMVSTITRGREEQTIQPIFNGLPSLRLTRDVIVNTTGAKLVLIPAGKFTMGSNITTKQIGSFYSGKTPSYYAGEHPSHSVLIKKPFYMGTTEVTVGQFRKFVEATGYGGVDDSRKQKGDATDQKSTETDSEPQEIGFGQSNNHPAAYVSAEDAMAFCDWLSRTESRTYRLPTEDEWEYACRAGSSTYFHFGDDATQLPQYENTFDADTQTDARMASPVSQRLPNKFALYDMHGNVSELCTQRNSIPLTLLDHQAYSELETFLTRNNSAQTWTRIADTFNYCEVELRSGDKYDLKQDKDKTLVLLMWDFGCCNHHGCSFNAYDAIIEQCDSERVSVLTFRTMGFSDSNEADEQIRNIPVIKGRDLAEELGMGGFPAAVIVQPGGTVYKVNAGGKFPDGRFAFDVTCAVHLANDSLRQWMPSHNASSWLKRYREGTRFQFEREKAPREHFISRGGHWASAPFECRSAFRTFSSRNNRIPEFGFRVVCEVDD